MSIVSTTPKPTVTSNSNLTGNELDVSSPISRSSSSSSHSSFSATTSHSPSSSSPSSPLPLHTRKPTNQTNDLNQPQYESNQRLKHYRHGSKNDEANTKFTYLMSLTESSQKANEDGLFMLEKSLPMSTRTASDESANPTSRPMEQSESYSLSSHHAPDENFENDKVLIVLNNFAVYYCENSLLLACFFFPLHLIPPTRKLVKLATLVSKLVVSCSR